MDLGVTGDVKHGHYAQDCNNRYEAESRVVNHNNALSNLTNEIAQQDHYMLIAQSCLKRIAKGLRTLKLKERLGVLSISQVERMVFI